MCGRIMLLSFLTLAELLGDDELIGEARDDETRPTSILCVAFDCGVQCMMLLLPSCTV